MSNILDNIKKYWKLALASIVALYVLYLRKRNVSLEAQVETASATKTDAVLATKQANDQSQIDKDRAEAALEHNKILSDEELAKELSK